MCSCGEIVHLTSINRRKATLLEENGQGLSEYGLILSLVAIVVIIALALVGTSVRNIYCQVIGQFPGTESPCAVDVVVITRATYDPDSQELHIDATSDGDYDPSVTLTVSPGGLMEARSHHYHLEYFLPGCPCEVTVTSSSGGSATVAINPS